MSPLHERPLAFLTATALLSMALSWSPGCERAADGRCRARREAAAGPDAPARRRHGRPRRGRHLEPALDHGLR